MAMRFFPGALITGTLWSGASTPSTFSDYSDSTAAQSNAGFPLYFTFTFTAVDDAPHFSGYSGLLTMNIRARATSDGSPIVITVGAVGGTPLGPTGGFLIGTITISSTTFTNYSVTDSTIRTFAEITEVGLGYGILLVTSNPSALKYIVSELSLDLTEYDCKGGDRAPRTPRLGEPAYYCAVCSRPLHRSALTYVTDDEHPQYGRLLCAEDYDGNPRVIDGESERLTEGDIDFQEPER